MADLALSYAFMTNPNVLQAANTGKLTIVVSNSGAPLDVAGIDFVLSQGSGARDIVEGVPAVLSQCPDGWTFPTPTGGTFTVAPDTPVTVVRQGLIFVFDLTVSSIVGTAQIAVTEHLVVSEQRRTNRGTLLVPKFPQNFALDGFFSAKPIVNQGDSVTLVWTGRNLNLANYQISYSQNNQLVLIDIPANTYSYTLTDISETSNFYLNVTSTQSSDIKVTRQSEEYLVSVNLAIAEFWASSSLASPGDTVTLNWTVSTSVVAGQITCLQSGDSSKLDQTAIAAGTIAVRAPAIGMTAQYRLDVFDSVPGGSTPPVASQTTTVTITESIPHFGSATGYFFTDAQAADVKALLPSRPITDTVVPLLMEEIFANCAIYYPDTDFYLDWENDTANTESFLYIDGRKKVVIHGGLARVSCLYYEAFCFIVAQCVARLSGTQPVDAKNLTYIGVADFQATSFVLRRVYYAITTDSDLDEGILKQLKTLFQDGISAHNQQGNPGSPSTDPGIACRYRALSEGIFGGDAPPCAT